MDGGPKSVGKYRDRKRHGANVYAASHGGIGNDNNDAVLAVADRYAPHPIRRKAV